MDIAPDGTVYAEASEAADYFTGPSVKRWLLRLDLDQGTSNVVFQYDRQGCCPLDNFAVDREGDLWWVLNPDFVLYHVEANGNAELFATQTPVDTGYANRNANGYIFLNSPEGVHRVWEASPSDRIQLVNKTVGQLVTFGALSTGQGRELSLQLAAAAATADRGDLPAAAQQVDAFLSTLSGFVREGLVDEKPADYLIATVTQLVLPYLR